MAQGKMLHLSPGVTVLSSQPSGFYHDFSAQHYRLQPMQAPSRTSGVYSLVLQVGKPTTLEWQNRKNFIKRQIHAGESSFHSVGELPAFCLHDPAEVLEISFAPSFVTRAFGDAANRFPADLAPFYGTTDTQIERIALCLGAEIDSHCPGGALLGESLVTALVAHLFAKYSGMPKQASPIGGLAKSDLQRVLTHIADNIANNLSLNDLAAITHLSPHHFSLRFKQSLGISPHQFVIRRRIEMAQRLLCRPIPLAQIAHQVGFASQSHFNAHFKRLVGVTPHVYRQQVGISV